MVAKASAERVAELKENIDAIRHEIRTASKGKAKEPRLILVTKLKPPSDILAAHEECGHTAFGENYIQELQEKAEQLPSTIQWHFIGQLQSNKCKALASIPNVYALETLDTIKKADLLEKALAESGDRRLRVYLQFNTSEEQQKGGVHSAKELKDLAQHIRSSCPHLEVVGLMTIGSYEASHNDGQDNPDFSRLREARDYLDEPDLELSMGMSADFVDAIKQGSDNVRVGSRAFGTRPSKEAAKAQRDEETSAGLHSAIAARSADTVNGVFNLNSLLEDLPHSNSASAPTTPFPDSLTKAPLSRGLHAHHSSISASPFPGFHTAPNATSPSLAGPRGGNASVFDYTADQPRSAYRMPRVINTSVFNGQIRRGRCKFFNSQKGFGFINDSKAEDLDMVEVFVHFTAIASNGGFRSLAENEECEYTLVPGPKGYQASNVTGPGGRPVVGDPKARAPVAKHAPPYMFVPPHGAHFYDPYHGHPQPYYPHSPYGQVMLSIVPTNAAAGYPAMAHPGYPQTGVPGASPYTAMTAAAAPPPNGPSSSSPSSAAVAGVGQHYPYVGAISGIAPPSSSAAAVRTSPFASTSPYSGLGLGPIGNPSSGKTTWQSPMNLGAIGGQRVSASDGITGRFGSPGLPGSNAEASPSLNAASLRGDIFTSNGVDATSSPSTTTNVSNLGGPGKRISTTSTANSSFDGPMVQRRSSTAQELFDNAGAVKQSPATHKHQMSSGASLGSASSLLYPSPGNH